MIQRLLPRPPLPRRCLSKGRGHVEHLGYEHQCLRPFLRRAMRTQRMPRLEVPRGTPISQHHRLALIRRLLTDDTIALRTRVAAVLMLLYASRSPASSG